MNITWHYLKQIIRDEYQALRELILEQKLLILALVCGLLVVVFALRPIPPRTIKIAGGVPESGYSLLIKDAGRFFAENGVRLEEVYTNGSAENLKLIADPSQGIDVALLQGGLVDDRNLPGVVSLGSVAYEPVWIFVRNSLEQQPSRFADLAKLRVAVGPVGGATRPLVSSLMALNDIDIDRLPNFISESYDQSIEDLKSGQIDVVIHVAVLFDDYVQKMIKDPELSLMNVPDAVAYEKQRSFLDAVVLPAHAIDIARNLPPNPINILATTTNLVVREDLHPDIQYLLLIAARDDQRAAKSLFFAKRGEFPAYVDPNIPESPIAKRFYGYGPTAAMAYLPFWLAGLLDRMWLLIISLVAIMFPLARLNLHLRTLRFHVKHRRLYEELLDIERRISAHRVLGKAEAAAFFDALESINRDAIADHVPVGMEEAHFLLLNAIFLLKKKVTQDLSNDANSHFSHLPRQ